MYFETTCQKLGLTRVNQLVLVRLQRDPAAIGRLDFQLEELLRCAWSQQPELSSSVRLVTDHNLLRIEHEFKKKIHSPLRQLGCEGCQGSLLPLLSELEVELP